MERALTLWSVLCYDGNSLACVLQSCCCLLMCCTGQIHTIHLQTHMDQHEHMCRSEKVSTTWVTGHSSNYIYHLWNIN